MAGFDLTKIGELIKNVETQILKNGGDTNSDGKINTDTEKSIFNQVLEEKRNSGELTDDNVNEIMGFVKSTSAKAPAKTDINDGDSVTIEINVNTNININLTVNADFNSAIEALIQNQNEGINKLIAFFKDYMDKHPDMPDTDFLAEFIKNILNQIIGEIDLNNIEDLLNKILEALDKTNTKLDNLQETIIKMAEDQLKFFNNMNLKIDEILDGIKTLTDNQEEQIQMLNTLTNVLNKLSADFGEFQSTTVGLLNGILDKIKNGEMTMQQLMEILKSIEADTSENNKLSIEILNAINNLGGDISSQLATILDAINKGGENSESIKNLLEQILEQAKTNGAENKEGFKAVLDALANIKPGEAVDLGSLETLLNEIKELLKDNNDKLGDVITNQDTLIMILNAFKAEVLAALAEFGDEAGGILERLDAIIEKLKNGNCDCNVDGDALMEMLQKILDAIKNHKCECDCGQDGTHEGILGDLGNILKAPKAPDDATDIHTTKTDAPIKGGMKFIKDGKMYIRGRDGQLYNMNGQHVE